MFCLFFYLQETGIGIFDYDDRKGAEMSYTIYAQRKRLGKQKKAEIHPVPIEIEKRPKTVRELLIFLVRAEVQRYQERKEQGELLQWLTVEEIADQAAVGKVSFGIQEGNDADEEKAAANAIQCFEDGIYRVFLGETELLELDEEIPQTEEMVFTFIRLTMLSGW